MTPSPGPLVLAGAHLVDGSTADLHLAAGVIGAIERPGTSPDAPLPGAPSGGQIVDLRGYLLLPSFVEPHAHLDKALTAAIVPNPRGDLPGAIEEWIRARARFDADDIAARAEAAARELASRGVTAIRTHTDTGPDIGLRAVEALLEGRARLAGLVDLQVVACAGLPLSGPAGAPQRELLEQALRLGADVVGGAPWLDDDPQAAIEVLADAAERHGRPLDAHLDETLDAEAVAVDRLIALAENGFGPRLTASHLVSLGTQSAPRQQATAARLAAAGIGVVVLPVTNLGLQARGVSTAPPRGLAPAATLLAAGVGVAAGGDNLRDPFNPLGRADPLEIAGLLVGVAHLTPEQALAAVTDHARAVIGAPPVSIGVGAAADLVAVRAAGLVEAIAAGPEDRIVWRAGRQIVRTRTRTEWFDADRREPAGSP